jgi:hypothetical protein
MKLWKDSTWHDEFDPDYFRLDILGNLVAIDIQYKGKQKNLRRKLAFDFEHLIAHSRGGKTNTYNICLLNSGINRSKKAVSLVELSYYEINGYLHCHGIDPEELLEFLDFSLHKTCLKYNLYFVKYGKIWTIEKSDGRLVYNNQYKYYTPPKVESDSESDSDTKFGSDTDSETDSDEPLVKYFTCSDKKLERRMNKSMK